MTDYVWKVELEERFNDEDYFTVTNDWTVVAEDHETAITKAEAAAMSKDRSWEDDDGEKHYVEAVRLVSIVRGDEIDA